MCRDLYTIVHTRTWRVQEVVMCENLHVDFFTLITIKCRSTSINSILRIFGMYFNLMFNSLKQS